MNTSIIEQVVEQLSAMPPSLQEKVLQFAYGLGQPRPQGTPGQALIRFAGSIPSDDLSLIQAAIEQDCEQVDQDEW